jgi:hypothetical protein
MNAAALRSAVSQGNGQRGESAQGERRNNLSMVEEAARAKASGVEEQRARIHRGIKPAAARNACEDVDEEGRH